MIVHVCNSLSKRRIVTPPSLDQLFTDFHTTGNPASLAKVFMMTEPTLTRQARLTVGNTVAPEDVVQELFLSLLLGRGKYDASRPCLPFLRGALHRQALRALERARRRPVRQAGTIMLDDPGASVDRGETMRVVAAAIDGLPPPYRRVLQLFLEEGYTPQEISGLLGRPMGTVRVQVHRGLLRLRQLLPPTLGLFTLWALGRPATAAASAAFPPTTRSFPRRTLLATAGATALPLLLVFTGRQEPAVPLAPTAPPASATSPAIAAEGRAAEGEGIAEPPRTEVARQLHLRVVDGAGIPVPNVGARLYAAGTSPQLDDRRAVSDAHGMLHFAALPAGRLRIDLDRGWRREFADEDVSAPRQAVIATGRTVRGRALLANGDAAAGAAIALCNNPNQPATTMVVAHADAEGRFELRCVHGRSTMCALVHGHAPSPLVVAGDGDREVTLVLGSTGATVAGCVRGPAGAVARATVLVGYVGPVGAHATRHATTAADGTFRVDDVPAGELDVVVLGSDTTPVTKRVVVASGAVAHVQLTTARGVPLAGRVVDKNGEAVGYAIVRVHVFGQRQLLTAETAEDGRFRLDGVPRGPAVLQIASRAHGIQCHSIDMPRLDHLITVRPQLLLHGQVWDPSGRPATADAWEVALGRAVDRYDIRYVEIGPEGRFQMYARSDVPDCYARRRGSSVWLRCRVERGADGPTVLIPEAAATLAYVQLRLFGVAKAQRHDLRVFASAGPDDVALGVVERDGDLACGPLPAGRWRLRAEGASGSLPPIDLGEHEVTANGAAVDVNVPAHGWLSWQVQCSDGATIAEPRIVFTSRAGVRMVRGAASGSTALAAGEWTVHAESASTVPAAGRNVLITAGTATDVLVPVDPARRAELTFRWPNGADRDACRLEVRRGGVCQHALAGADVLHVADLCLLRCVLAPGEHELHLLGPKLDQHGTFVVDALAPAADPIAVEWFAPDPRPPSR